MAIFVSGAIISIRTEESQEQPSNDLNAIVGFLEIFVFLPILAWRIYESCVELEDIHEKLENEIDKADATFRDTFKELINYYMYKGVKVDMASPKECSYRKWDDDAREVKRVILGKRILPCKKVGNRRFSHTPMDVQYRGITLRQLRAIYANIVERCEKEGWVNHKGQRLTPETVTLYDIDKYIVKPFTKDTQASFVETLPSTGGTQPPRFFLSHWWGESFVHTLACLEQFVKDFSDNWDDSHDARGGGMTEDTPICICAFANNQWELQNAISDDLTQSSFNFVLPGPAKNKVITILDANGKLHVQLCHIFDMLLYQLTIFAINIYYN